MPANAKPDKRITRTSGRRGTVRQHNRAKLSTTVAAGNFAFLETMVDTGRTESIAEAVDLAISGLRRAENRDRLDRATAAYFERLSPEAQAEERTLAHRLHATARDLDFDLEH